MYGVVHAMCASTFQGVTKKQIFQPARRVHDLHKAQQLCYSIQWMQSLPPLMLCLLVLLRFEERHTSIYEDLAAKLFVDMIGAQQWQAENDTRSAAP